MGYVAKIENNVVTAVSQGTLAFADAAGLTYSATPVEVGWVLDEDQTLRPPYGTVSRYRFLFELFHDVEQLVLDALRVQAATLTGPQMLDPEMSEETGALVVLRNAYERFKALHQIELGAPATLRFLETVAALGVFGPDPEVAALRVQQIRDNVDAPELAPDA
jgi:hypothetical protein